MNLMMSVWEGHMVDTVDILVTAEKKSLCAGCGRTTRTKKNQSQAGAIGVGCADMSRVSNLSRLRP